MLQLHDPSWDTAQASHNSSRLQECTPSRQSRQMNKAEIKIAIKCNGLLLDVRKAKVELKALLPSV